MLLQRVGLGLGLLIAVSGCGGGSDAKSPAGQGGEHAEVGKHAPDLSIQTLNGKGTLSLDTLQGKVVVVDFWATWCGPCKQSFPKLEELSKKMGDRVQIVGVSCDDEKKGILDFAKENGATFAIGWDEGHSLAQRWKVDSMPTTFIVDGTGTVRHVHSAYHGDDDAKEIEKEVAALADAAPAKAVAKTETKPETKSEEKADPPKEEAKTDPPPDDDKQPDPPKKKPGKKKGGAKKSTKKKPAPPAQ